MDPKYNEREYAAVHANMTRALQVYHEFIGALSLDDTELNFRKFICASICAMQSQIDEIRPYKSRGN